MSMNESVERCIFCGATGAHNDLLTDEHVLSKPVLALMDVDLATGISHVGGLERFAGPTSAETFGALSVRCVCAVCNNEWMSDLDSRFAKDVRWWANHGGAKLGDDRLRTIRRYMAKLLWVGAIGENWTTAAWIKGERPEPEFIPLGFMEDGQRLTSRRVEALERLNGRMMLGATRIPPSVSLGLAIPGVSVEGVNPTMKILRLNAAVTLNLRRIGLQLHIVSSGIPRPWDVRWPRQVAKLHRRTRYNHLPQMSTHRADDLDAPGPHLHYTGPGRAPDIVAIVEKAMEDAAAILAKRNG